MRFITYMTMLTFPSFNIKKLKPFSDIVYYKASYLYILKTPLYGFKKISSETELYEGYKRNGCPIFL